MGGALEQGDRRVRLEQVGHDLRARSPQLIAAEAANEASKEAPHNVGT